LSTGICDFSSTYGKEKRRTFGLLFFWLEEPMTALGFY